ncbi:predicted protein, partial [Nematostella vectensis]
MMRLTLFVVLVLCFDAAHSMPLENDDECKDQYASADCKKAIGDDKWFCEDNKNFMLVYCRMSCGYCVPKPSSPTKDCVDSFGQKMCEWLAQNNGYCNFKKSFMEKNCRRSCGFC